MTAPRLFAVHATDAPGRADVRAAHRPAHRAHLRAPGAHPVTVVLGGPLLDAEGGMTGTLLVVSAASAEDVHRFLADDPYVLNGLFARLDIRPWQCGLARPELLACASTLPASSG